MLTPETLDYILNSLGVHKELQESIIREIVRKIVMGGLSPADAISETVAYQAEILQKSGVVYEDMVKIIAKKSDNLYYDIMTAFDAAEVEIFNYDDEILLQNGKDPEVVKNLSPVMRQLWEAAFDKAFTDADNLTKTIANVCQNVFISSCDLAHMQIASGAFSYGQAIANAVKEASKQSMKVVYPSGATASVDYAVRRAVLTSINQSAGQIMSMRAQELNHDLMQTTAHYGARPEHAEWQGQVVSMSGAPGYLSAADIGYGSVTGIFGANCNHSWYMYFGHSAYTPEELQDMKDRTVTYNGQEMSEYDARQKQRGYERSIKRTKAELVGYDEALKHLPLEEQTALKFQFQNASVKLKGQEAKLSDFCRQTGLKRDKFREQMFATETEDAIKAWSKSTSSKAVWANRKTVDKIGKSDIIKEDRNISSRNMANGLRKPPTYVLSDKEIESLKTDIEAIGADENIFKFNAGRQTAYDEVLDEIRVRGDVLPDTNSLHPRDLMSSRAVLAHEYYGHRAYRGTKLTKGSWNDEFRASYMAAKNTPNLTDEDRRYLVLDALERAKESGVSIRNNDFIRRILYGDKNNY